jgi:hypothetical protein
MVNGQLQAMVNGQLQAMVNGEDALINGEGVAASSVRQLANGQLQAMVNGSYIPIANGQLQAMVNGQLLAMVNGQLMALVNGELTFVVFRNGQLQAMVNGQLQAMVNGQLLAMVNGQLQEVNSYTIINGQLQAMVNGQQWVYANGQLLAMVNGQLQAMVNNFDVSGSNNNSKTLVVVDGDDIIQQAGSLGAMFSMNMITGLDAGTQTLVPGAFVNENFEVTYGLGQIEILKRTLIVSADNKTKKVGSENPPLTITYTGLVGDDTKDSVCLPLLVPTSPISLQQLNRKTTYTDVKLNGGSNFINAVPGQSLTLTGNYNSVYSDPTNYCPGCVTQIYIGMTDTQRSGATFTDCYNVSGTGSYSGAINKSFTAPATPGVYYITQVSSWEFNCYDRGAGMPGNNSGDAIAVVVVNDPYAVPALPKEIKQLNRVTTYSDIKLNGLSNVIYATSGQSLTLTGNYNSVYSPIYDINNVEYCPSCITQIHIGLSDGNSGNVFNDCIETNGGVPKPSGTINRTFTAPTAPGVYYLTQESTWWYNCGEFADPVHINVPDYAIAVVIVYGPTQNIKASTTAGVASPAGSYPITLYATNNYNPNYEVTLQDGTLSITNINIIGKAAGSSKENAISEVSNVDKLSPNPAFSLVRLELTDDVQRIGDIQLYDLVGKLTRMPVRKVNEKIYEIDVSALSKGVYFLKVKTQAGLKTFKFIKM